MTRGTVRAPMAVTLRIEALRARAELRGGVPVSWARMALTCLVAGLEALERAAEREDAPR